LSAYINARNNFGLSQTKYGQLKDSHCHGLANKDSRR